MKILANRSEKGQALILIVGALIGLLAFTALAIDGGMVLYDRRSAQNAADAAALAGAYTLSWNFYLDSSQTPANITALTNSIETAVHTRAHDNHYDILDGKTIDIAIYSSKATPFAYPTPPSNIHLVSRSGSDNTEPDFYIQVTITSTVNTSFLHFIYSGAVNNTVTAVAHVLPQPSGPLFGGSALVSLAPTECANSSGTGGGIRFNGNGWTNLIGGGMFVNSNASCSVAGNSGGFFVYTPSLTDVGGVDPAIIVNPTPGANFIVDPGPLEENKTTSALTYPPTFDMGGLPTCGSAGDVTKTSVTKTAADTTTYTYAYDATPGFFSAAKLKSFPFGKDVWFEPGIYCFETAKTGNTNFNLNGGHVGGNDVLFAMTGTDPCNFSWNSNTVIKFQGYKMGSGDPHAGILLYVDPLGYQKYSGSYIEGQMVFNGTADSFIQGTIFAPTCSAQLNGTNGNMYQGQVAAYNIVISGNNTFFMNYDENMNYKGQQPTNIDLSQ